jgi:hypothetical protein
MVALVRGSWFVVRGSWFVVRGSWFVVRGSWFVLETNSFRIGALILKPELVPDESDVIIGIFGTFLFHVPYKSDEEYDNGQYVTDGRCLHETRFLENITNKQQGEDSDEYRPVSLRQDQHQCE